MPRKIFIVLSIIVVILIVITGALFYISRTTPKPDESSVITKIRDIFPFGKTSTSPDTLFEGENEVINENNGNNTGILNEITPRLRKIYAYPTSGSKIYPEVNSLVNEKKYFIRFVERSTGHIYDAQTDINDIKKISNTTIPKVYEAKFINEKTILDRLLKEDNETIKTYFLTIKDKVLGQTSTSSTNGAPTKESIGNYLEEGIKELAVSPLKNRIIYSLYNDDGGSIITSNIDGTSKKLVYSSKLREWLLDWQNDQTAIITTKPSGYTEGYSYFLNINTGTIKKNIGNIIGLTILSKPGTNDFLIGSGGGGLSLSFLRKQSDNNSILFLTRTLPEKCAWSKKDQNLVYCAVPSSVPSGAYPDDWYQGTVSFNDILWRINVLTGQSNIILNPQIETGEPIDMIQLDISDDDSYLTFINKNDLSLWGYQIIPPVKKETAQNTATTTNQNSTTTKP